MKNFKILLMSSAKDLPEDLYDRLIEDYDLEISPSDGEIPCPWDSDMTISNGSVTLTGSVNPGGIGSCTCTVSLSAFRDFYVLKLWRVYEEDLSNIKSDLAKYGWVISNE